MLTPSLQEAIRFIPDKGWFEPCELSSAVSRASWTCCRLEEEGILESKVNWAVESKKGTQGRTDFSTIKKYRLKKKV